MTETTCKTRNYKEKKGEKEGSRADKARDAKQFKNWKSSFQEKQEKTQALIQPDSSFDKTDEEFKWTEGEAQRSNGQFKTEKKQDDFKGTR